MNYTLVCFEPYNYYKLDQNEKLSSLFPALKEHFASRITCDKYAVLVSNHGRYSAMWLFGSISTFSNIEIEPFSQRDNDLWLNDMIELVGTK